MVEISHLTKHFGAFTAVDDVSFKVNKGEVLGFLGPNGAGKSTTMKMITGFLTPDAGTVTVGGDNIANSPVAVKSRIGYLPEGAPLYSDMTPEKFLHFVAEIRGMRGTEKARRVDEVIQKVNLESVVYKPIETLSKGFKRRVGLAQAIIHDPVILILDEPTDGLDPNQKHEVRSLIQSMASEKVIILSTHILEEVDAVCTRAMIIANGKLLADGTPASLAAKSPLHNSVEITIRTDNPDPVNRELEQLNGIKSVEKFKTTDGCVSFRVYSSTEQTPISLVNQLAHDKDWKVENLHVETGRMDDVFRSITTQQKTTQQKVAS
ncbi:MAG: ATP-binding cassette domain-containing protein [Gammaproteobacteria bacterium]|nr:ATP-binding cassette domain-containing protein [Gammaproteobacteria bacterium]